MDEKIIFQQDRLTVTEAKIIVGNLTVYYPSVSATSIFDGRPLLAVGIMGIAGSIFSGFLVVLGARMFGSLFSMKAMAVMLIPMLGMAVFGFTYNVKCLFLSVDGSSVAVLKSKDRLELEVAQRAIEGAKRTYELQKKKA